MNERVFRVVAQVMGVPAESINQDSSPDNVKSWDSLKQLNLVLALEEEFEVQFSQQQILEMLSVALVVEVLKEALNSGHIQASNL